MSESRVLAFVDERLNALVETPRGWGPDQSVEDQVLQLLELRRVIVLDDVDAFEAVASAYRAFKSAELGGASPDTLAARLARGGRAAELGAILSRFVEQQRFAVNAPRVKPEPIVLAKARG